MPLSRIYRIHVCASRPVGVSHGDKSERFFITRTRPGHPLTEYYVRGKDPATGEVCSGLAFGHDLSRVSAREKREGLERQTPDVVRFDDRESAARTAQMLVVSAMGMVDSVTLGPYFEGGPGRILSDSSALDSIAATLCTLEKTSDGLRLIAELVHNTGRKVNP